MRGCDAVSKNFKKLGLGVLLFVALTVATYSVQEIFDEVTKRIGFGPRQLVPESLWKARPVPPEVKAAQERPVNKELETGSLGLPENPAKEAARQASKAKCLREKARAIAEEDAKLASIKANWESCVTVARWWPLVYGDAQTHCKDWGLVKLAVEAGLESVRSWSC